MTLKSVSASSEKSVKSIERYMTTLETLKEKAVSAFEDAFVNVVPEEEGISRWKKNSNPDHIPAMLRAFADEVAQAVREERDREFLEVNIVKLLEQMKESAEEYGQYHDDDCPFMREDGAHIGDVCECEKIRALKSFAGEWMGKINEWWVTNTEAHRKHCTPEGNKVLTRLMGKKNRKSSIGTKE